MGLAIVVLSVFMVLHLGSGQTPPRPNLSNSFSAEVTDLTAGAQLKFQDYVNYEEQKLMQLLDLGPSGAGYGHAETLVLENTNMMYSYFDAFNFCTAVPGAVEIPAPWSWVANATFKGTEEFKGMKVDVWTYQNTTEDITYEVAVQSSDPETPVYYLDSTLQGPVLFSNYINTAPPESKFAVPPTCNKAPLQKRLPHHSSFYLPRFGVRMSL